MKYFLDITFDEPVKIESSEHDSIESALNVVYQCVQPRIRGASLPFHAWVHPTGVKQLTLDLRRKLEGKSFSRSKQLALVSALLQKIRAAVQGLPLFNTTNAPKMACKRFSRSPYGVPSYSCSYSSMKCCASLRASNPSCSTM